MSDPSSLAAFLTIEATATATHPDGAQLPGPADPTPAGDEPVSSEESA